MQLFTITNKDGSPVLVDPHMHAVCLRLPLADMAVSGLRGVEFVLKTQEGRWLQPANSASGNFHVELPLVATS